jgi:septum formation protein
LPELGGANFGVCQVYYLKTFDIILVMKKIILASSSPRRGMLLKQIGLDFETVVSNFEEKIDLKIDVHKLAEKLSLGKAKSIAKKYNNAIIIAADTFVVFNGKIIGKPKNKKDAKRILRLLSGKIHLVITGFTILDTNINKSIIKSVETKVTFKNLSNKEIDSYIKTGEPLDKAGAYGIQEKGSIFVKKIDGDFFNIVGLPIYSVVEALKKFSINV